MRLLIVLLLLSFVPITTVAEIQVDRFTCKPWSNGGLRMRGDVQLELSGLHLMWTNGKNTQTALMMNPEDKLEGTVSGATKDLYGRGQYSCLFPKEVPKPPKPDKH